MTCRNQLIACLEIRCCARRQKSGAKNQNSVHTTPEIDQALDTTQKSCPKPTQHRWCETSGLGMVSDVGVDREYKLSNYYIQEPIGPLLREPEVVENLTKIQRLRAKQLAAIGTPEATHVRHDELFINGRKPAAWKDRVAHLAQRLTQTLHSACAVRVEFQTRCKALSKADVQSLAETIDAVAQEVTDQWSGEVKFEIDIQERRLAETKEGHALGSWIPAFEVSGIDRHPKWQQALGNALGNDSRVCHLRRQGRRRDDAATIVGFLEKELWLQKHQREPLMKLVIDALPEKRRCHEFWNRLGDLSLLTVAFRSQAELSMLTAQQKDVWRMLSAYFEMTPRTMHMLDSDGNYSTPIEILR